MTTNTPKKRKSVNFLKMTGYNDWRICKFPSSDGIDPLSEDELRYLDVKFKKKKWR